MEARLASRPVGELTEEHFELVDAEVGEPGEGEFLVRNDWMLLSVVMRDLMEAEPHPELPMSGYQVGEPPWAPTVGTVVRSNSPEYAVGDLVRHTYGFREHVVGDAGDWAFTKLDPDLLPGPHYHLNQGPTAWRGMVELAGAGEGDTVFVSAATSGVGSVAGQIARCRGAARVIGSTGSKDKIGYLVDELGFDAAFDYHDGPVAERLAELAPDGIDVFFDNVAGEQFEAALRLAAPNARFVLCGGLSGRNPTLDLEPAVLRDVTFRGFTTSYEPESYAAWTEHYSRWLREGRFVFPHTVVEGGIAEVPRALVAQLRGAYRGTALVKLS
ncbi:MDR family NADP-dependent oxidoreductase [Nonomuraea sp. SYSU D8015]|uniref:MDR family NADP-dependent oxidoreductase n=1 Tax=Nonomuraea sp. SYSU D8015 TaxID=2593644 RepID=UPI0016603BF4|nr:NADP-dependent oxidoreductase [Nonomuraea sp. SYSU D8015]